MPDAYISGASQAYLALAGLALVTLPLRSPGWSAALVGALVAVGLDLFVSGHGQVKVGHTIPFAFGSMIGVTLHLRTNRKLNGSQLLRENSSEDGRRRAGPHLWPKSAKWADVVSVRAADLLPASLPRSDPA